MTNKEFFEIFDKYHLHLTGHQIWIGNLYHIANLEANTMYDYKIIYFNKNKREPSKEVFEKFVQKYVLINKQNEVSKRISKMKGDFE